MPTPKQLAASTQNAFDFLQRLHLEVSYLIREVEEQLKQADPEFVQMKGAGYAVSTSRSSGLEPHNVKQWMSRTLTVGYCPKKVHTKQGTPLPITARTRVLILHIVLHDADKNAPKVWFGRMTAAKGKKGQADFEKLLSKYSQQSEGLFTAVPKSRKIRIDDSTCVMEGKFRSVDLFTVKKSKDVTRLIVEPMLAL